MISRRTILIGAAAALAQAHSSAVGQSYPDRPIKMIVPFPPGGPIECSRLLAASPAWQQRAH